MNILDLMRAVYDLLKGTKIEEVKTIFEPGKPIGPFAQSMPAILIVPGTDSKSTDYPSADHREDEFKVYIGIYLEDIYSISETRNRGDFTRLCQITDAVEKIIENNPALDGLVEELEGMTTSYEGPSHSVIAVRYFTRQLTERS